MILDTVTHLNDRVSNTELARAPLPDVGCPLGGCIVIHTSHLDLGAHILAEATEAIVLLYL